MRHDAAHLSGTTAPHPGLVEEITMTTTDTVPEVITRYLHASDAHDSRMAADCFTVDGTVEDEGRTYTGREEIFQWREHGLSKWTYTTTVTGDESVTEEHHRVMVRVEGNFPGGLVDLTFDFTLRGGLVAALRIVG
jgi:hypothetical protein